jgi:hypothetical protein
MPPAVAHLLYTSKHCSGLCVARLSDGSWSAPVAVRSYGISWGLQAGLAVTDYVVLLNTDAALDLFRVRGQVCITLTFSHWNLTDYSVQCLVIHSLLDVKLFTMQSSLYFCTVMQLYPLLSLTVQIMIIYWSTCFLCFVYDRLLLVQKQE